MNFQVIFRPNAERDLDEMEEYLALRFSPHNAARYVDRIIAACKSIGVAPYRGTRRDDIRPGVRTTGFEKRVTITFEVEAETVVILGIFYGGRMPR